MTVTREPLTDFQKKIVLAFKSAGKCMFCHPYECYVLYPMPMFVQHKEKKTTATKRIVFYQRMLLVHIGIKLLQYENQRYIND
mmetsp:Transcript_16749/g.37666  ORF Transcript_16749/g.37666 Transcript_16749/m.37666 type:complete len:83 (-) Transcript_16749:76-324(-)